MAIENYYIKGSSSVLIEVMLRDSTTGQGKTGLVSSDMTIGYMKEGGSSATTGTVVDLTLGTFTIWGFKEVDAAKMPGLYQFGVPGGALTSGDDKYVTLIFKASGMIDKYVRVILENFDRHDKSLLGSTGLATAAQIASISGDIDTVDTNTQTLITGQTDIDNRIASISGDIATVDTVVDAIVVQNNANQAETLARILSISGDITDVDSRVASVSGDISAVSGDIQTLLAGQDDIDARIVSISGDIAAIGGTATVENQTEILSRITSVSGDVNGLVSNGVMLSGDNHTIKSLTITPDSGIGLRVTSPDANAVDIETTGTNTHGVRSAGAGSGAGFYGLGGSTGSGFHGKAGSSSSYPAAGVRGEGDNGGAGIYGGGGSGSGMGIGAVGGGNGIGFWCIGAGSGVDLRADAVSGEFTNINARMASISGDISAVSGDVQTLLAGQTTIATHLTDIKGTGFVKDTHSLVDIITDIAGLSLGSITVTRESHIITRDSV